MEAQRDLGGQRPHAAKYVDCPAEVVAVVIGTVRCQILTVPARRGDGAESATPGKGEVRLHLTRIRPPGTTRSTRPILVAGTNLGATPNYLGISPLAQRTQREVIIVDPRGTGHSLPSLDCPEAHEAAGAALDQSSQAADTAVVAAISECASRLAEQGIDVGDYSIAEMGADLRDVRHALGLSEVDVAAYGSTSLAVAEMMRIAPEGVRSVMLDSPVLDMPPRARADAGLTETVDLLLSACRRDDPCTQRYLASGASLEQARRVVRTDPMTISLSPRPDRASTLVLDEERLLRVLRQMTSDGGSSGTAFTVGSIPRLLRDVAHRDKASLQQWLGPALSSQEPFCLGRSPSCLAPRHHLAIGAWLTNMCTPPTATSQAGDARTGSLDVTATMCQHFVKAPTSRTATWDAPTFITVGRFSTYSSPQQVWSSVNTLPQAFVMEDPAAGSPVLTRTECTLAARDRWLQDPTVAPDAGCLAQLAIAWE